MLPRKLSILTILFSGLCLVCSAQDASKDYSILNGNWYLTGGWVIDNVRANLVTLGMGVDGNMIYGVVDARLYCTKASNVGQTLTTTNVGHISIVRGLIASDGSFVLEDQPPAGHAPFISIKGKLPEAGANEWSGSMSTTGELDSTGLNCTTPSVDFLTSRLVLLTGTYIGSASNRDYRGNSVSINVELALGEITSMNEGVIGTPNVPNTDFNIPHALLLIGAVTMSSTSGTITADSVRAYDSSVFGAHWSLMFALKDGSSLEVEGERSDPSGAKLSVELIYSTKGKDGQVFWGTLTRR